MKDRELQRELDALRREVAELRAKMPRLPVRAPIGSGGGTSFAWGKVQADWSSATPNKISLKTCTSAGVESGDAFDAWIELPMDGTHRPMFANLLVTGLVLAYFELDGEYVLASRKIPMGSTAYHVPQVTGGGNANENQYVRAH